jgi:glucosylceramidase
VTHVRSRSRFPMKRRLLPLLAGAALLTGCAVSSQAQPASFTAARAAAASSASEPVNIWLTTTSGSSGRTVTRGLQQQTPVAFSAGHPNSGQVITVDERTKYQQFTGGGASMTDTAGYLLGSSGAISSSTQSQVMTALFSPTSGIGLDFLRNPMGASDLARSNYSYDDMPSGQTDPGLAHFSISHDLTDILPLTKDAEQLNPNLKLMMVPWSAPAWMKDNDSFTDQGDLQSQYYAGYAQYFVKTIQAYQAQGVHVDYVSAQNEPGCCSGATYPTMAWNGSGLDYFTANDLLPAFHAAGLSTKVLALDWNWSNYADYGATEVNDAGVRNDPLFGGVAWHGYDEGSAAEQSTVHNEYPGIGTFDTEHSGGTWIANQQQEDMQNIIDYTRNWGQSVVKWSLAVDQNDGPHNGGCSTCTGLITVHNGDSQSGQVTYTIEYYDMGQLTKFVKPGAYRIASTASSSVPNVAWINPDGSKALVAYNQTGTSQPITVNWGGESFTYTLPAQTSATFTWAGAQSGTSLSSTGTIGGYGGLCLDVAGGNATDGTTVDQYTCNGTSAQQWTVDPDSTVQSISKCLDVVSGGTADGTKVDLYSCNGTGAQVWQPQPDGALYNPQSGKCLDDTGWSTTAGNALQIWDCAGTANQVWTLPTG